MAIPKGMEHPEPQQGMDINKLSSKQLFGLALYRMLRAAQAFSPQRAIDASGAKLKLMRFGKWSGSPKR